MNKKIKVVIGVIIILVVIGAIVLNANNSSAVTLKIGVIAPLSGLVVGGDNLGEGFANGLTLAHEEYTKANPNKNIEIFIENDGYDSKKGVSAYQKLTSIDKINALVNVSSPTIDAVVGSVVEADIPVIQLGAESNIAEDNIYQIYPDQTSVGLLGDLANKESVKKLLIVHPQVQAYEKFISDVDAKYDGEIMIEKFSPTEKNMTSVALKIKETNPEGLVIFMGSVEGAQLLKKLRELGYLPKHLYFDQNLQWGLKDYTEVLGTLSFINGAKGLYSTSDTTSEFKKKYQDRFGTETPSLAGLGYDSYYTMISNYDKNTDKWRNNMNKYSAKGVTGAISFSPSGLRPAEWQIAEIVNDELVIK